MTLFEGTSIGCALDLFLGTGNRSEAGRLGQIALLEVQSRFNLEVWGCVLRGIASIIALMVFHLPT